MRPPFDDVKKNYQELTKDFLTHYPEPHYVDYLQSENDKKQFILAFRDIIKKHAEIQVYDEFDVDAPDLGMTEQQFMDFRSKYLDIHDSIILVDPPAPKPTPNPNEDEPTPEDHKLTDIDFCLELLHSDIINVAYILELIADLNPYSEDYSEKRKHIIDTMIRMPNFAVRQSSLTDLSRRM